MLKNRKCLTHKWVWRVQGMMGSKRYYEHARRLICFFAKGPATIKFFYRRGRPSLAVRTKALTRRGLSALDMDDSFLRACSGALREEAFERPRLYLLDESSFECGLVRSQRARIDISGQGTIERFVC